MHKQKDNFLFKRLNKQNNNNKIQWKKIIRCNKFNLNNKKS